MSQKESGTNPIVPGITRQSKRDKNHKQVSSSQFFHENPDLFRISPRPGGFLTLLVPSRSQDFIARTNEACSRECVGSVLCNKKYYEPRGTTSLQLPVCSRATIKKTDSRKKCVRISAPTCASTETSRSEIKPSDLNPHSAKTTPNTSEYSSTSSSDSKKEPSIIQQQSMEMLAVTISCVMQMAARLQLSPETLEFSKTYLQCMKDEHGKRPRNIVAILNHIRKLLGETSEGSTHEDEKEKGIEGRGSRSSIGSSIFSTADPNKENKIE